MSQPAKVAALRVHQEHPFNAGPPLDRLCQAFFTPQALFYVRNHGDVPQLAPAEYALTVSGLVRTSLHLSLAELRERFQPRTIAATLVCAGNRRDELAQIAPIPDELAWGAEAIGNAVWEGVALAEVLAAAGIQPEARHVAFTGLDHIEKLGQRFGFGGSIALDAPSLQDVLLAYAMNGEPLSPNHGFPLRAVVPGQVGARSVKWLANINVQAEPSDNFYQTHAYKLFPPEVTGATVEWSRGQMLQEAPLATAICEPADGAWVQGEHALVRGYAYAGGRGIARVEVSCDGREPWSEAALAAEQGPWTWRLWKARLPLQVDTRHIVARAWDDAGNGQPEDLATVWNFKGYANSAWHRVAIRRR